MEHGRPVALALLPLFPLLNPHSGNEVPGKVSYAFLHNTRGDHVVVAAAGERRILSPRGWCCGVVLQAGLTTAPALLSPRESEPELTARIEAQAYYVGVCVRLSARREFHVKISCIWSCPGDLVLGGSGGPRGVRPTRVSSVSVSDPMGASASLICISLPTGCQGVS